MSFSKRVSSAAYFALWDYDPVIVALRAGDHDGFIESAMKTYINKNNKHMKDEQNLDDQRSSPSTPNDTGLLFSFERSSFHLE